MSARSSTADISRVSSPAATHRPRNCLTVLRLRAGDVFDLFSGVLCFHGGCGDGEENQNGLCYKKPLPGYKCESFLCYKQYPEFENNGMLHTFAHVTKKILMDTGQIPATPPPGTVKSGLLFYKDPGPDYNVVAGVAWEKCKPGIASG